MSLSVRNRLASLNELILALLISLSVHFKLLELPLTNSLLTMHFQREQATTKINSWYVGSQCCISKRNNTVSMQGYLEKENPSEAIPKYADEG